MARPAATLPPGPRSRLRTTARFTRDPYGTSADCAHRYGDPFTLPMLGSHVVVTGRPQLARAMYALPPDQVGGLLGHLIPEILGPTSVLVRSGRQHTADRKLLTPLFRREAMQQYTAVIADVTRAEMATHSPGTRLTAYELGRSITLGVILRAMFGVDRAEQLAEFRQAVLRMLEAGSPPLIFFPSLRRGFLGLTPWDRVRRRLAELDRLYYAQIERRRARAADGTDILGHLLRARYPDGRELSDQQLRDQLMSYVLAGHETMSVTLAWALYWVLTRHDVRARLDQELAGADGDVSRLPYLEAVCLETLRIYPIQPIVLRYLLEPVEFAGYRLPAGSFIGAANTLVHMDAGLYPDPERFDPGRFADSRPGGPGEYFPFGGGARRCLGAGFATEELKIILAVLLAEYRLRCLEPAVPAPARQSTVTGPGGGVRLVYDGPVAGRS
jgi:cytochrome P450 family 110